MLTMICQKRKSPREDVRDGPTGVNQVTQRCHKQQGIAHTMDGKQTPLGGLHTIGSANKVTSSDITFHGITAEMSWHGKGGRDLS